MTLAKLLTKEEMMNWLETIEIPSKLLAVQIQEDTIILRKLPKNFEI